MFIEEGDEVTWWPTLRWHGLKASWRAQNPCSPMTPMRWPNFYWNSLSVSERPWCFGSTEDKATQKLPSSLAAALGPSDPSSTVH